MRRARMKKTIRSRWQAAFGARYLVICHLLPQRVAEREPLRVVEYDRACLRTDDRFRCIANGAAMLNLRAPGKRCKRNHCSRTVREHHREVHGEPGYVVSPARSTATTSW